MDPLIIDYDGNRYNFRDWARNILQVKRLEEIHEYGTIVALNKLWNLNLSQEKLLFRSIINEANCGEFIEAENIKLLSEKIIEYSNKPKNELKKMGLNGKKYLLENLSYDKLGKKYLQVITEDSLISE